MVLFPPPPPGLAELYATARPTQGRGNGGGKSPEPQPHYQTPEITPFPFPISQYAETIPKSKKKQNKTLLLIYPSISKEKQIPPPQRLSFKTRCRPQSQKVPRPQTSRTDSVLVKINSSRQRSLPVTISMTQARLVVA